MSASGQSRHVQRTSRCLLSTKSGHPCQRQECSPTDVAIGISGHLVSQTSADWGVAVSAEFSAPREHFRDAGPGDAPHLVATAPGGDESAAHDLRERYLPVDSSAHRPHGRPPSGVSRRATARLLQGSTDRHVGTTGSIAPKTARERAPIIIIGGLPIARRNVLGRVETSSRQPPIVRIGLSQS